jgi:hypothetical protein
MWTPCYPAIEHGTPTRGMLPLKSAGCTCSTGLGALGAATLTAAAAMQQAISQSSGLKLNPAQFQNAAWLSAAAGFIEAGALPTTPPYGPNCSGQPASNMSLLQMSSGIGLAAAGATTGILVATQAISAVTGAVLGAATLGVGALISVIAMIFEHHAAAVARDLAFGCSAIPAVNNAFAVINKAVQSGQTTPAAAAQSLQQIYTEYQSAGGAAINDSPWCNSNCELGVILQGMVIYWESQYNAMAAAASAAATPVSAAVQSQVTELQTQAATAQAQGNTALASSLTAQAATLQQSNTASAGALPSWAWLAAAAVGAFLLFK